MPQLTSTQSGLIVSVAAGNSLRVYARSGTPTVTGSSVAVEDATSTLGCYVYGPQASAVAITLSTTGVLEYDVVAGDPTPDRGATFNPTTGMDPASLAAVRKASLHAISEFVRRYELNRGNNPRVSAVIPSQLITFGASPAANTVGYANSGVSTAGYTMKPTIVTQSNVYPANAGTVLGSQFRVEGGMAYGNNGIQGQGAWAMNTTTRLQSGTCRILFSTDEPKPMINGGGSSSVSVLNVDDGSGWKRVYDSSITTQANGAFVSASGGGLVNTQLDFSQVGGRKKRNFELIAYQDYTLTQVGITAASTWYDPPVYPPILLITDSIPGTVTGTLGNMKDGYAAVIQDVADAKGLWLMSEGGTGFVATSGGSARNHLQKLQYAALIPKLATIQFGIIQASVNDNNTAGVQAATVATLSYALTTWPGVYWVVVGPTSRNTALDQGYSVANEQSVAAAIAQVNSPLVLFVPTFTASFGQAITGTGTSAAPAGNGNADFLFDGSESPGLHFSAAGNLIWGRDRVLPELVDAFRALLTNAA